MENQAKSSSTILRDLALFVGIACLG
uniref:Uncharacterized protein n=1 Tax=Anguilla anguilla TaxID=7936 RepID=A0A0E9TDK1_ANGAN